MTLIPIALVNMNYCLPAPTNGQMDPAGVFFFLNQETVNTDYVYDSLWRHRGHISALLSCFTSITNCSNWTGLMDQDVSCFPYDALTVPQTSLQPGLNKAVRATIHYYRWSGQVLSESHLWGFLSSIFPLSPGLCCLLSRSRINSTKHIAEIQEMLIRRPA